MKKFSALLLALILLASTLVMVGCGEETEEAETLVIYNWADYIYDFEDEFKEYYKQRTGKDINIIYVTFDTNETMLTKIMNNDANVDIMCPSEYAIQRLVEGNYLYEINYFTDGFYKNSANVSEDIVGKIRNSFSTEGYDLTKYMVPYMWGTLGVLYNADEIDPELAREAGWGLLWNENGDKELFDENISNRIFMKDSIRDVYCAVMLYLKQYDMLPEKYKDFSVEQLINTVNDELVALALNVLIKQKDVLYGYEVDFGKNDLVAGNALVDLAWSGDAIYAIEEGEAEGVTLDYFVPTVGGNIWLDGWVIPKTCKNVTAAKIFIDYLNKPDVAMKNMMEIGYTSAVDKQVLLDSEEALSVLYETYEVDDSDPEATEETLHYFFDDERRYPTVNDETLGVMHDFGGTIDKVVAMWEKVRSTGISVWGAFGLTIAAVAVIVGVFGGIILVKSRKNRRVKIVK